TLFFLPPAFDFKSSPLFLDSCRAARTGASTPPALSLGHDVRLESAFRPKAEIRRGNVSHLISSNCSGPRRLYLLGQSRLAQSIKEMLVVLRVLERDKLSKAGNTVFGLEAHSLGRLCAGLLKMAESCKGRR